METRRGARNSGIVGDRSTAQRCSVIALDVLNCMDIIRARRVAVGNADDLIVLDRIGERELNGGTIDRNSSNGVGASACCDREGRTVCCCCGEVLVVSEDNFAAIC